MNQAKNVASTTDSDIVVMKFGGSSVADNNKLKNVASRVIDHYDAGKKVVVVVSAQGDTTDDLLEKAAQVNPNPSKREMDVLLSTGEQISMSLLAMTLENMGKNAVSITGWQAGIKTEDKYSNARIISIDVSRIMQELNNNKIVIVAGFQGINSIGDITTLGRGGSDTTAVALACELKAEFCEIYTDVDGVYTTDPRIVPNAKKLTDISYDEMLELASLGANVLHNRSVELAMKYNLPIKVLSSFERISGTIVKEMNQVEKLVVRGVARDNNTSRISVIGVPDEPGEAFQIFDTLAKANINVDLIIQSVGQNHSKNVSFTVAKSDRAEAIKLLEPMVEKLGALKVNYNDDVSKVSIVGAGMVANCGVAAAAFKALSDASINIKMIATSEIKISVLVDEKDGEGAVKALHNAFIEE